MGRRNHSDDGSLISEIAKGVDAEMLLQNKTLKEKFQLLKENIYIKWEATHAMDKEGREDLWRQLHSLNEITRALNLDISRGKQAEKKMEKLNG